MAHSFQARYAKSSLLESLKRTLSTLGQVLLPVLCAILSACGPQHLVITREPTTLRFVSAGSCVALATRLAEAYEETYPWVTVHLETYNSLLSEQALRQDEADVALLSWSKQDTETILWTRPVFKDGLVVIAHPATPFTEMNLDLLQEIYRGRIQEWGDSVLVVVTREDGSGTRAAFDSAILQGRDITLTAVVMISNDAVIQYVADTPGSIGYISTLQTSSDTSGVKMLPLEGILPTRATIQEGSYALVRELHLATVGEPTGEAREFAQWVLGPKGQAIINDLSD